ncbi:hypothetical protein A3A46_03035 [Candidatus Roizmanbacteria bacterium RIFCSPLOWO2_01_FULL_37_13]|uniref:Calcineurin-like phosphoesterase domain-containing protein n=1 Tax=Candidatus Roizmanbacteria bacterium RIFCSPHIGHO2_02_FULL_38_11 TaxID=1802039 RepID=A0A1F7GX36_9BACT|nr:MAG: hypothetical protein A3C25_01870 [Candidatus Roizmanbacteria bacterium RIFCSPHIGHO2_02_FULL_38_11]OGK43107.1 MAG: hypothetical protein A3A46_03035 [Candidatus Roizmanbacteria bacterium RIFCSPLOWO2_01_FULL_37_13]
MKILVFSDSHLTDKFEEKKFYFLKKIIRQSDFVIINGDFWDGYLTTFNRFISSNWSKLFPLLKSKKTIYIYGNHDRESYIDRNVSQFSDLQTHAYRLQLNGTSFIFEHGHRLYPAIDEKLPRSLNKILTIAVGSILENVSLLQLMLKRVNRIIKKKVKKELGIKEMFVCGHSHYAEFDLKNRFINTGFIENGLAQYLIIDKNKLFPKEEWYD